MTDTFDFNALYKGQATTLLQKQFVGMEFNMAPSVPDDFDLAFQPKTGGILLRSAHPLLWERISNIDGLQLVDEAQWQALKAASPIGAVSAYSTGDGATTFRLPTVGTAGGVTRSLGEGGTIGPGDIDGGFADQIQNITGEFPLAIRSGFQDGMQGAFTGEGSTGGGRSSGADSLPSSAFGVTFDASLVARTGDETSPKGSYVKTFIYTGADTTQVASLPTLEQLMSASALKNLLYNTDHARNPVNQYSFDGNWGALGIGDYGYDGWLKYSATHKAQIVEMDDLEDRDYLLSYDGAAVKVVRPPQGTTTNWLVAVPFAANELDLRPSGVKVPYQREDRERLLAKCYRYYVEDATINNLAVPSASALERRGQLMYPVAMVKIPQLTLKPAAGSPTVVTAGAGLQGCYLEANPNETTSWAWIVGYVADATLRIADAGTNLTVVG